jgi:hypothetical protein
MSDKGKIAEMILKSESEHERAVLQLLYDMSITSQAQTQGLEAMTILTKKIDAAFESHVQKEERYMVFIKALCIVLGVLVPGILSVAGWFIVRYVIDAETMTLAKVNADHDRIIVLETLRTVSDGRINTLELWRQSKEPK